MPEKETVRLWDLLSGTHWTLLLLTGANPTAETIRGLEAAIETAKRGALAELQIHLVATEPRTAGTWTAEAHQHLDRQLYLHRKYGDGSPGIYLIRPDRYVGFRGRAGDGAQLASYLSEVFGRPPDHG